MELEFITLTQYVSRILGLNNFQISWNCYWMVAQKLLRSCAGKFESAVDVNEYVITLFTARERKVFRATTLYIRTMNSILNLV